MEKKILIKYVNVDIYQQELLVLKKVHLEVHSGEFIYLLGKVGSGKSSLLKSFYSELPIYEGDADILGYDLKTIKSKEVPFLRRKLGIVFQDFQLLSDRTVYSNLEFVLKATGWINKSDIETQIHKVLHQVGMSNKGYKMPHQLSGGEQQRIVIARALLNSPEIILADEPTGNLDPETGKELVQILYNIRKSGTTVIIATHNLNLLEFFKGRILRFENNEIAEVNNTSSIESVKVQIIADNDQVVEEQLIVKNEVIRSHRPVKPKSE